MTRRDEQLSLFAALNAAGAEYVVVGGVAVNAYGHVRNTRDLDVFMRPSVENAERVLLALRSLGVPLPTEDATDLLSDDGVLRISTSLGVFELLNSIGEMSFDRVWRSRNEQSFEGVTVPFISRDDLLENKRQVGRTIDLWDVEELEQLPELPELLLPRDEE